MFVRCCAQKTTFDPGKEVVMTAVTANVKVSMTKVLINDNDCDRYDGNIIYVHILR